MVRRDLSDLRSFEWQIGQVILIGEKRVRWPPFHCWQWFGGAPSSAFINLVMLLRVLLGLSPPIRGVANEPSTPKPLLAMVKGLHQFTFC